MYCKEQPLRWLLALSFLGLFVGASSASAQSVVASQVVTYNCTGAPCPWGPSVNARALVWPSATEPANTHYQYTVTKDIFLPADKANGTVIIMTSGSADLFAGTLASENHRFLTQLSNGGAYEVTNLAPNEYLSVLSNSAFSAQTWLPADDDNASRWVTWTCNSSPCPWGSSTSAHALEWPESAEPLNNQINYTVNRGIYLHSSLANGAVISLTSGSAEIYAGSLQNASHRLLVQISAGGTFNVAGLLPGEYLSVLSGGSFTYDISLPTEPIPGGALSSKWVTWTCRNNPCPWGSTTSSHAIAWPAAANAGVSQLNYTASDGIYLHWATANGTEVSVTSGSVELYAGALGSASHRLLMTIGPGGSYEVSGLAPGEYLSGYSTGPFTYEVDLGDAPVLNPSLVHAKYAFGQCETANCNSPAVYGPVISWPAGTAYSNNNRAGHNARTFYSVTGERLYPYMGSWANGCRITVNYGVAVIVEWQRGTETWRETTVGPGQTHVIQLVGNENSALIETYDSPTLGVSVTSCNPQPVP